MKQFLRDYLTFNKRERNGLFVLVTLLATMLVYLNVSHLFYYPETVDFTEFEKEIDEFMVAHQKMDDSLESAALSAYTVYSKSAIEVNKGLKHKLFDFNPNLLSPEGWKNLGFTARQVQAINNYQAKGGVFRSKKDVQKMYVISEEKYQSLEPHIKIPVDKKIRYSSKMVSEKPLELVELNAADSIQLVSIKGIGGFYAKQILKYRKTLGGFIYKEQLLEVWKFDSLKLQSIYDKITVDIAKVKKININTFTAKEIKHPYLSWNVVNVICNYRSKHGNFETVPGIKNTGLVDEALYRKVSPYLVVN